MEDGQSGNNTWNVGLIGCNPGNGHPFSFSAIINGYNPSYVHLNPYTVINEYLSVQSAETYGIKGFKVSHIWTQEPNLTTAIARYSNIEHEVNHFHEMRGKVDAVIIARDDAETHKQLAQPFLDDGIKVFIDKPLAQNFADLQFFSPYLKKGQLMSCSGLRFLPQVEEVSRDVSVIGGFKYAYCTTPNDWFKYGIHSLEGIFPLISEPIDWVQHIGDSEMDMYKIHFRSNKYLIIHVLEGIQSGIRAQVFNNNMPPIHIIYNDNFSCFKKQLQAFRDLCLYDKITIPPNETEMLIKALLAGNESRLNGNQKVLLNAIG